jgi:hypothetical protein
MKARDFVAGFVLMGAAVPRLHAGLNGNPERRSGSDVAFSKGHTEE